MVRRFFYKNLCCRCITTVLKKAIPKAAAVTGNLIDIKTTDKIKGIVLQSASSKSKSAAVTPKDSKKVFFINIWKYVKST